MTEEIIIDCIHKPKGSEICNAHSNNVFSWNCSEFNNCYYKQLKRLEQENKELKKTFRFLCNICSVPTVMYNEYERERFKYGRTLEEISGLASPHCTQCSQIINIINEVLK